MRQPGHNLCYTAQNGPHGHLRSADQDDRQAKAARGSEFGRGAHAAGVLRDHMGDAMALHQCGVIHRIKRAAGYLDRGVRQRQRRLRFIDQPQQVVVLGFGRELGEVLFTDSQKHLRRGLGQSVDGFTNSPDVNPSVTLARLPGRAFKGAEVHARCFASLHCIGAHLRCERVGCIDDMGDGFGFQIGCKPVHAAKAANTGGQRLADRLGRAAGIRKHRIRAGFGERLGERRSLAGAAQKKDACHV